MPSGRLSVCLRPEFSQLTYRPKNWPLIIKNYRISKKVILTGATGMVGEGVLIECLDNKDVSSVLYIGPAPKMEITTAAPTNAKF